MVDESPVLSNSSNVTNQVTRESPSTLGSAKPARGAKGPPYITPMKIKKIMQQNPKVGKVSQKTTVYIAHAVERFVSDIVATCSDVIRETTMLKLITPAIVLRAVELSPAGPCMAKWLEEAKKTAAEEEQASEQGGINITAITPSDILASSQTSVAQPRTPRSSTLTTSPSPTVGFTSPSLVSGENPSSNYVATISKVSNSQRIQEVPSLGRRPSTSSCDSSRALKDGSGTMSVDNKQQGEPPTKVHPRDVSAIVAAHETNADDTNK